jgi:hypothetical protein
VADLTNRCANLHWWILLSTLMGVKLVMDGLERDIELAVNSGGNSGPTLGEGQGLALGFSPANLI